MTTAHIRPAHPTALALAAVLLAPRPAPADLLPIVNPGFESLNTTLRPGEQTNGAGGGTAPVGTLWRFPFNAAQGPNQPQSGVIVPGWRTLLAGGGSLAGVLRPDVLFAGVPWMTGYSGAHIAAAQAAQMQQTINAQLAPRTTYTLGFLAGIGITDSDYAPLIALCAAPDLQTLAFSGAPGVITLARAPLFNITRDQFGTMRPFSFSYTTPDTLPPDLVGKYLAISFVGSDGLPRMCYDDFTLDASAVPAPAAAPALGSVAAMSLGRRRRAAPTDPRP